MTQPTEATTPNIHVSQEDSAQTEVVRCQQELQECKDKFLRVTADFDNFKRRQEKEKVQWARIAQAEIIKGILDIVDNFERALHLSSSENKNTSSDRVGVELIYKELLKFLQSVDVEPILDQAEFDPEIHEAISAVEDSQKSSGSIAQVLQKGYRFKGILLRPAKVSIVQ